MSKVLSLQNLSSGGEHWFNTPVYGKKQIEAIQDPEGGDTHIVPTSIPSPFAQIDLVRSALINVCKNKDLSSTTIDFKLVSDCLDVGNVFFNIDRLRDKVQIVQWDKEKDLENLLQSSNRNHHRLGEVLKLYLEQDAKTYNFKDFRSFNLLIYDHKPIGGTSPKTLFFTSANDLSFAQIKISTSDTLFDQGYKHLWERDDDYIRFLFAMRKAMPDFGTKFKEFSQYLDKNLIIIERQKPELYDELNKLGQNYYAENFDDINLLGDNNKIQILNDCFLRKAKTEEDPDKAKSISSDFIIQTMKCKDKPLPLVLVPGHDGLSRTTSKPLRYFRGNYNKDTVKPDYYSPVANLSDRNLPGLTGEKYPHLLVSDFLEPYLIRLVYPINKERFFDGHLSMQATQKGYLLPIKKAFFNYFDTEDLISKNVGGNKMFEMKVTKNDAVEVKLRIPIQNGNYITFERIYHEWTMQSESPTADERANKGYIMENQFGVNVYPMVGTSNPDAEAHYRIILVDRDILDTTQRNSYHLSFYQNRGNTELKDIIDTERSNKQLHIATTKIYATERGFNYITVNTGVASGILIPLFIAKYGSKEFSFAIDFGTTNTHIELKTEDNPRPIPFEITSQEVQIGTLGAPEFFEKNPSVNNTRATPISEVQQHMMPENIGAEQNFRFPQRTVLYENPLLNFSTTPIALADMNIAFGYEKETARLKSETRTNLKWANISIKSENPKRIATFFEQLMFMLRTKVLLNGGDLSKTKLIWFYPTSMTPFRQEELETMWCKFFEKHIGAASNVSSIPESLAPFYHYKNSIEAQPAICIDIGGGTTDVVIFNDEKPRVLTSFRFAANAIFGDAYAELGNADRNGFVLRYEQKFKEVLEANGLSELMHVLNSIRQRQLSEDIVTFFFSLENNREVKNKKISDNMRELLSKDADMKIVFILFYSALMYHIAQLMLVKNIELPKFITFSGNGSKALGILAGNKTLARFTKLIFEKIYDAGGKSREKSTFSTDGLSISHEENSKEITCKGGLLFNPAKDTVDINSIKTTLLGTPDLQLADTNTRYNDANIKNELLKKVEKEVFKFIDFTFDLNDDFSFYDNFGASVKNIDEYRLELKKFTEANILKGLNLRLEEMENKNKVIDETFFFYPLVAALNRLALFIHHNSSSKTG